MENDYYAGLNFQLQHIQRLEEECNSLHKSNRYHRSMAINNKVSKQKSKELQKELDIIEDKIRTQELENKKINQQKNNLNKIL